MYDTLQTCFMSGTGNSLLVSRWISNFAASRGLDVVLETIDTASPEFDKSQPRKTLLALVNPTHGFTAPWHMIRFALRLPRVSKVDAVCIATRAGFKAGRIFTPGISGTATFLLSLILFLKGFRVRGVVAIDMPSNWIIAHPGLNSQTVEAITERAKPKAEVFIEKILQGEPFWLTLGNICEFVIGAALAYVSLMYILVGRFIFAKIYFANGSCTGCGLCEKECPVGAIRMRGGKPWPYWRYNCENCMKCIAYCPEKAVEVSHSWFVALFFILSLPFSAWLISAAVMVFPLAPENIPERLVAVINFFSFYPALFLSYMVFDLLLRIPVIRRLFTLSTFTHFWRKYHQPGIKVSDLRSKTELDG